MTTNGKNCVRTSDARAVSDYVRCKAITEVVGVVTNEVAGVLATVATISESVASVEISDIDAFVDEDGAAGVTATTTKWKVALYGVGSCDCGRAMKKIRAGRRRVYGDDGADTAGGAWAASPSDGGVCGLGGTTWAEAHRGDGTRAQLESSKYGNAVHSWYRDSPGVGAVP